MTDHLEPFRRMVRSMRFVPPLPLDHGTSSRTEPTSIPSPGYSTSSWVNQAETEVTGPAPDPTEYAAALVQEAVSKPTILPTRYEILENIGDRIARMGGEAATGTPTVEKAIVLPKIPQPDPNWLPPTPPPEATVVEELEVEELENVEAENVETQSGDSPAPEPVTEAENIAEPVLEQTLEETREAVTDPVVEPVSPPETDQPEVVKAVDIAIPEATEEAPEAVIPAVLEASVQPELSPTPEAEETPLEAETSQPEAKTEISGDDRAFPSNKLGISCPHCHSSEIIKNGHYKDKQRYACKDCGKTFVGNDAEVETPPAIPALTEVETVKATTPASPSTKKSSQKSDKSSSRNSKKSAKGFGGGKTKKK